MQPGSDEEKGRHESYSGDDHDELFSYDDESDDQGRARGRASLNNAEYVHDDADSADAGLARQFIEFPAKRQQLLTQLILQIKKRKDLDDRFDAAEWQGRVITSLMEERGYEQVNTNGQGFIAVRQISGCTDEQLADKNLHNFLQRAVQKALQEKLVEDLRAKYKVVDENGEEQKGEFRFLSVAERNEKFEAFKKHDNFNLVHKHTCWDSVFGLKNTATWRNTMKEIRDDAYHQLQLELRDIQNEYAENKCQYVVNGHAVAQNGKYGFRSNDHRLAHIYKEQIKLLESVRKLPIFNEHRNNSIFAGAGVFWQTKAVQQIDQDIKDLQKLFNESYQKLNMKQLDTLRESYKKRN